MGDLFEDAVTEVVGLVGAGQRSREQRVDLVHGEHAGACERDQPGDVANAFLCRRRRRAQAPLVTVVASVLVTRMQIRLTDVVGSQIGSAEQHERAQRLVALPHRVGTSLGEGVDETIERVDVEILVADDGPAFGA